MNNVREQLTDTLISLLELPKYHTFRDRDLLLDYTDSLGLLELAMDLEEHFDINLKNVQDLQTFSDLLIATENEL